MYNKNFNTKSIIERLKGQTTVNAKEFISLLKTVLGNLPRAWVYDQPNLLDYSEVQWIIENDNEGALETHLGDFCVEEYIGGTMIDKSRIVIGFYPLDENDPAEFLQVEGTLDNQTQEYIWDEGSAMIVKFNEEEDIFSPA